MPEPRPTLISIERLADHTGLSTKTIRRRIADGTIPAFRVGGLIRIDRAAAERALLQPMNEAAQQLLADAEAGAA